MGRHWRRFGTWLTFLAGVPYDDGVGLSTNGAVIQVLKAIDVMCLGSSISKA